MALLFAVAQAELFARRWLEVLLVAVPGLMHTSDETVTVSEVLSSDSREGLLAQIAESKANEILRDRIRGLGKFLNVKMKWDITEHPRWDFVVEAFERRDAVAHLGARAGRRYCERVPNAKEGMLLNVTPEYLRETSVGLLSFLRDLHSEGSRRIGLPAEWEGRGDSDGLKVTWDKWGGYYFVSAEQVAGWGFELLTLDPPFWHVDDK